MYEYKRKTVNIFVGLNYFYIYPLIVYVPKYCFVLGVIVHKVWHTVDLF